MLSGDSPHCHIQRVRSCLLYLARGSILSVGQEVPNELDSILGTAWLEVNVSVCMVDDFRHLFIIS